MNKKGSDSSDPFYLEFSIYSKSKPYPKRISTLS
jgi:hypothetical protein